MGVSIIVGVTHPHYRPVAKSHFTLFQDAQRPLEVCFAGTIPHTFRYEAVCISNLASVCDDCVAVRRKRISSLREIGQAQSQKLLPSTRVRQAIIFRPFASPFPGKMGGRDLECLGQIHASRGVGMEITKTPRVPNFTLSAAKHVSHEMLLDDS